MGRRSAGTVEVYHALRFLQGAEELGAPLTGIVGGLIADFVADHRIRWRGGGGASLPPYCSRSGSDQQVVLPADPLIEQQVRDVVHCGGEFQVLIGAGRGGGVRLQDGGTALSGDLIDGDGAVGGGVVAHGVGCV